MTLIPTSTHRRVAPRRARATTRVTQKKQPTDEPRLKKYWTSHALDPYRRRAVMAYSSESALLAIEGELRDENDLFKDLANDPKPLEVTIEAWREVDGGTEDLQTSRIVLYVPQEHDDPAPYDVTVTWVATEWIEPVVAASPAEALDLAEDIVREKICTMYGDKPWRHGVMAISVGPRGEGVVDTMLRRAEDLNDPPGRKKS